MSQPPIRIGHPDLPLGDVCGCCDGTGLSTLRPTKNRPNLTAIAFRAGDHASFKASMLTGLASAAYPALAGLGTRADDDFSIALIDAWASACDVLTFYQERLANEAYLGSATERLSVAELARLTGYRVHPGASAETDLVILMEDPPGAAPDVTDLVVPAGTRVQSQPGPEEVAQTFETMGDLDTRVSWNRLLPRPSRPRLPRNGDIETWVAGLPSLAVGDVILFVSRERGDPGFAGFDDDSPLWDLRRITGVEPSKDGSRTRISWNAALDSVDSGPDGPTPGLVLHHLRDRAALFGFNAPHPLVLTADQRAGFGYADAPKANSPSTIGGSAAAPGDWVFAFPGTTRIHLDNLYKTFLPGGWLVLDSPNGVTQAFRLTTTGDDSRAAFAISGKAQRIDMDTNGSNLALMLPGYRGIAAYGGSAGIALAETPETRWITGGEIELSRRVDDLPEGRRLIIRGRRAVLELVLQTLAISYDDGGAGQLLRGDHITLMDGPSPANLWPIRDPEGRQGQVIAEESAFRILPAPEDAEMLAIPVLLREVQATDASHSTLILEDALGAALDRASVVIHANVARAAHGEGTAEILGGGDPARPFQRFLLKQAPVSQRQAPTETGVASTLTLRIDGVAWQELPDLYQRGAAARVFRTSLTDTGETVVEFGDGVSGARPPAGRDNIQAEYSRGLGAAGNLRAGQLKLPLDRPLGLKETDNPLPATGGVDAEAANDARRNAPLHTLTLGRVVSLTDYRDFALGFPGIEKAEARWIWQGDLRRIVVTVAGEGGKTIPPGSSPHANLLAAFRALGDPLVSVDLLSYAPASFRLGLRVKIDPAHDSDTVLAATEAHLRDAFAFAARDFAQSIPLSEVAEAAHQVAGVAAIDVDLLARNTAPQTAAIAHDRLVSLGGRTGAGGVLLPAEILTLDPGPLAKLEVMA